MDTKTIREWIAALEKAMGTYLIKDRNMAQSDRWRENKIKELKAQLRPKRGKKK